MKPILVFVLLVFFTFTLLHGDYAMQSFQSGKVLEKRQSRVDIFVTFFNRIIDSKSYSASNYGVCASKYVHEGKEVSLTYSRVNSIHNNIGYHYLAVSPKTATGIENMAISVTGGFFFGPNARQILQIQPALHYSTDILSTFSLNCTFKYILFATSTNSNIFGANIGLDLFPGLGKHTIIPELFGYFNPSYEEWYLGFGLGYSYTFQAKRRY